MKDKLFFDTETTGTVPSECGLIDIAMIRTTPDGKILDEYESKIVLEPARYRVEPKALQVNHYSPERWADAQPIAKVLVEIKKRMVYGVQLVGHNTAFDRDFVAASFKREGLAAPETYYHLADTMPMGNPLVDMGLIPNVKLVTLSKFFGVPHEDAHTAMCDARACMGVYWAFVERYYRTAHPR